MLRRTMATYTSSGDTHKLVHTTVEDKMLQSPEEVTKYLKDKEAVYETPRNKLRKNLSVAEYIHENGGIVVVKEKKGSHWATIGHWDNGQTLLYPEEAIYGLECGILLVYERGIPWSVQQAYHTLLKNHQQLLVCQVYAHLKRTGFIVLRRSIKWPQGDTEVVLDVFKGSSKTFKMTSPGPPHSTVFIARPQDSFPSLVKTEYIVKQFMSRHSHLQYAIVNGKEIAYLSLHLLDTPPTPVTTPIKIND